MIQTKPIIHMDEHGELKVIGKERGRKKALTHIVDMAVKQSEGWDNDIVMQRRCGICGKTGREEDGSPQYSDQLHRNGYRITYRSGGCGCVLYGK